jgi:hypothetical protein
MGTNIAGSVKAVYLSDCLLLFIPVAGYQGNRDPNAAGDNNQGTRYHEDNDK